MQTRDYVFIGILIVNFFALCATIYSVRRQSKSIDAKNYYDIKKYLSDAWRKYMESEQSTKDFNFIEILSILEARISPQLPYSPESRNPLSCARRGKMISSAWAGIGLTGEGYIHGIGYLGESEDGDCRIRFRNEPPVFKRRRADSLELPLLGEVRCPLQMRMPALPALVRFSPGEERRGWIRCRRENENNDISRKIQ